MATPSKKASRKKPAKKATAKAVKKTARKAAKKSVKKTAKKASKKAAKKTLAKSSTATAKQAVTKKKPFKRKKPSTPAPALEIGPDVLELIRALDDYKLKYNRPFPGWSEVLHVLKSLGYKKR